MRRPNRLSSWNSKGAQQRKAPRCIACVAGNSWHWSALGQRNLSGARSHPLLRGHLCWRRNGQFEWEREELDFSNAASQPSNNDARLPSQRIDRINSALQDRSIDVSLDFGAFGRFYAPAVPQEIRQTSILPHSTRSPAANGMAVQGIWRVRQLATTPCRPVERRGFAVAFFSGRGARCALGSPAGR